MRNVIALTPLFLKLSERASRARYKRKEEARVGSTLRATLHKDNWTIK
jgi:hypothetical protein